MARLDTAFAFQEKCFRVELCGRGVGVVEVNLLGAQVRQYGDQRLQRRSQSLGQCWVRPSGRVGRPGGDRFGGRLSYATKGPPTLRTRGRTTVDERRAARMYTRGRAKEGKANKHGCKTRQRRGKQAETLNKLAGRAAVCLRGRLQAQSVVAATGRHEEGEVALRQCWRMSALQEPKCSLYRRSGAKATSTYSLALTTRKREGA